MAEKLWETCQKCGCNKIVDAEKLCESCKRSRHEYWNDIKKIAGVAAGALLTVIVGRRFKKQGTFCWCWQNDCVNLDADYR